MDLEGRVLLSVAPGGEKFGALSRLSYDLIRLEQDYDARLQGGATTSAVASDGTPFLLAGDRVVVDVATAGDTSALAGTLQGLGMRVTGTSAYVVEGDVPIASLSSLAGLDAVRFVAPSYAPASSVGTITTEGDVSMHSDAVRNLLGYTGEGTTVGVLSDSFNHLGGYAADIVSGDLPAGVNVVADSNDSTDEDEGRAMLQIVHDVAPGAGLAFATANGGQLTFANNIRALANAGADVIVDDVSYFAEPFFQDGLIAQAVDQVVGQGVAYFSSAANNADKSYQSAYRPGGSFADGAFASVAGAPDFFGGVAQDFDPSGAVENSQSITLANNAFLRIELQWAQPFFSVSGGAGSNDDYDIYLINSANQVVAGSATDNVGGDPNEFFFFRNQTGTAQTYQLMIVKFAGPDASQIKYVDFRNGAGGVTINTFDTHSSTIVGHSNALGAESVGAAFFQKTPAFGVDPAVIERFSSIGTTPILFNTSGNLLGTPDTRSNKPGIVAPDGVSTTVAGFSSFFGTSAAAPHAAAVAALLLQVRPTLTPAQIYNTMESTALDMGAPGFDNVTGHGLLQANLAVVAISQSDLAIVKTVPGTVTAGATMTYQLVVTNNGRNAAPSVVVTDALPANTTFVSETHPVGFTATTPALGANGTVTFNAGGLGLGSAVLTITVLVGSGVADGAFITNTASVSSAAADAQPLNNTSSGATLVQTRADLSLSMLAPEQWTAGTDLTYTFTVTNNGPSDAQAYNVSDVIPAGTSLVSFNQTGGPALGGTLPAGATATFAVVVRVNPNVANGTTLVNTASVSTSRHDPNLGNNTATATTTVATSADLAITKQANASPVAAGSRLTFTIQLANNGPSAAGTVAVTDAIPAGTTFVSAAAPSGWTANIPVVGGTGTVKFARDSLAPGVPATFSIVVQLASSGLSSVSNTASVSSTTSDPVPGNNTSTTNTTVSGSVGLADLVVTKTSSANPVTPGANLTYTVSVRNTGVGPALNVVFQDTLSPWTTFVSNSGAPGWTSTNPAVGSFGSVITSTAPSLAPGATATFTIVVKVPDRTPQGTLITNIANATTTSPEVNPHNQSISQVTVGSPPPATGGPGSAGRATAAAPTTSVTGAAVATTQARDLILATRGGLVADVLRQKALSGLLSFGG